MYSCKKNRSQKYPRSFREFSSALNVAIRDTTSNQSKIELAIKQPTGRSQKDTYPNRAGAHVLAAAANDLRAMTAMFAETPNAINR